MINFYGLNGDGCCDQSSSCEPNFLYMNQSHFLKKRFLNHILKKWEENDRYKIDNQCVYAIMGLNYELNEMQILYIGSTKCLKSRYKSHSIPEKIYELGLIPYLKFIPIKENMVEYEIKLINKLKPYFNKKHK